MFTGIIQEAGIVKAFERTSTGVTFSVLSKVCGGGLRAGASLAVNGCCLTVVHNRKIGGGHLLKFDLLAETVKRTNLQFFRPGESLVNLERSLAVDGRLDGHFVTGHIDGIARIVRWEQQGADHMLELAPPLELLKYIIAKGSIALDGISLTVAEVKKSTFVVWIIPHTYQITALRGRKAGQMLNIETDLLGKYVERFIAAAVPKAKRAPRPRPGR